MVSPDSRYSVVVGLDYSNLGDAALLHAVDLLRDRPQAELHAVHVATAYGPLLRLDLPDDVRTLSSEEATEFLKEHVARRLAEPGMATTTLAVRMHVRVGTPADEIVALAKELDADLIVVGTHGRRGVRRLLLGSVARAILRHAGCPVLVVRQKQTDEDHHD